MHIIIIIIIILNAHTIVLLSGASWKMASQDTQPKITDSFYAQKTLKAS